MPEVILQTPIETLNSDFLSKKGIKVLVKREDKNHPLIMGNKWRKLKYNLQKARQENRDTIVTYGGAYSNHILATAAAAKILIPFINRSQFWPDHKHCAKPRTLALATVY